MGFRAVGASPSANPADAALAIYRRHDMSKTLGRLRAVHEVAEFYAEYTRELSARVRVLETAAARAIRSADEAGRQSLRSGDAAFAHADRADGLDAALAAERGVSASLRKQLCRAEAQLATERDESALQHAAELGRLAVVGGGVEAGGGLEARARKLDALVDELNGQLIDAERALRAERGEKALLARAVLRDQRFDHSSFEVQTIIHVAPGMPVLATHLRPSTTLRTA
ncbi:hypothetical protein T492DRAFT_1065429 [Pavlovales sp. CCMP2436]|nr:hypothetical protein T492DRAFT_1065429 [Pavlovales sp. CCMP2436]|mmetsp:Transcript_3139/g.7729  ORF Transcript_3139/g.7729 Transcript_3139/m.7729 type:complete len:228 (+) Transcript_3139:1-684(+)